MVDLSNRLGGAVVGAINTELQPGVAKREDLVNGVRFRVSPPRNWAIQGLRANGWEME